MAPPTVYNRKKQNSERVNLDFIFITDNSLSESGLVEALLGDSQLFNVTDFLVH